MATSGSADSVEPRYGCHDRLRLLDDDHVARRCDTDEFGTGDALTKRIAVGWRDHPSLSPQISRVFARIR